MTRDQMLRTLASAQAFCANAMRHLLDNDKDGLNMSLYFVRADIMRVEAALKVQHDQPTREKLGLPAAHNGREGELVSEGGQ